MPSARIQPAARPAGRHRSPEAGAVVPVSWSTAAVEPACAMIWPSRRRQTGCWLTACHRRRVRLSRSCPAARAVICQGVLCRVMWLVMSRLYPVTGQTGSAVVEVDVIRCNSVDDGRAMRSRQAKRYRSLRHSSPEPVRRQRRGHRYDACQGLVSVFLLKQVQGV